MGIWSLQASNRPQSLVLENAKKLRGFIDLFASTRDVNLMR
jgi:hypothetical protein